MLTLCLAEADLVKHMTTLRDHPDLHFEMLSDVCGVDYLDYGVDDWRGNSTTAAGYTRAKRLHEARPKSKWDKPRFAVVYHLLSLKHNRRIRVKVYLPEGSLKIPSVIQLWPSADWFEREAYDLYGIEFVGHPDLRRLLTDYGFKGHPFRKDFPLEGHVEMFYDAEKERCVYQPVTIHPRVNIPKVIRDDARYVPETGLPKEETSNG
jgi:NADH-quinone oxidoreductase subunit C